MVNSSEQCVRTQVLLREVNERIAELAGSFAGDMPEFLCECIREDCGETVALTLPEYERVRSSPNLFPIVPGHESREVDRVVETRHSSNLVEITSHLELVLPWHRDTPQERGLVHA
jgi:hypothetical protein